MEGPLNNLQPSMIQFSKPKRTLSKAMDQFRRHETSARDYLPGTVDDRESGFLCPTVPFPYVTISQPADRVPLVVSTRASIEHTMHLGTFRLTSNRCARKPLTRRGYRCSPRTVHSERGCSADPLPSAGCTGVTPAPSFPRTDPLEPTVRASSGVQLVHPTGVQPTWGTPSLIDCGGGLRSLLLPTPRTWAACRSTTTRDRMISLIWTT